MTNHMPICPGDTVTCSTLQFSGNWTVDELVPDKHLVHIIQDDYHCWVDLDDIQSARDPEKI